MTLLAASIAIVAMIAGCGGDDSTASNSQSTSDAVVAVTTSSLSKPEFIKKASAACREEKKGLVGEASAYLNKHSSTGLPNGTVIAHMAQAVLVPTIEAEMVAIRKLGAPAGDEEQVETMLGAQQKALDEVAELKEAKSLEAVLAKFADAAKQLEAYGFTACVTRP
jgi:hypothetical protein